MRVRDDWFTIAVVVVTFLAVLAVGVVCQVIANKCGC
jgi:nitrate reductase NapE component